jgi:hypothetical protein
MTYAHEAASAEVLFDYLDGQASLGSHMQKLAMSASTS